ncbi:MAG: putative NAD-dependent epimerase/dehydratase [Promethearchaeota archaeon]|nr:MAG: putative NAD-dependent epimerase/dehydratase [Candidatus Lokiarchaeota archaeon]
MTKHILITGGLGYIGSILYKYLTKEDWQVEILDNHLYKEITPNNPFIEVDIRDREQLKDIIKKFDVIINLAAVVGDPACLIDTRMAIDINCMGTRNVAELCNNLDKYIIHASTCSIYGSEPNIIVKEQDEGFPIDFYGQTKYTQERLVREICNENSCIFRFGTAYGLSPRMRYDLVVNTFASKAIKDGAITIFGGSQERPFVHIRDISRAIIHAIKNELKDIYNLSGENLSLNTLGEIVKDITNCEVHVDTNIVDKRSYIVDNSKLKNNGFEYKFSVQDAIEEIIESPTVLESHKKIYSNLKLAENLKITKTIRTKAFEIIKGGVAVDDRGTVSFANDFHFYGVKRFYQVENFMNTTIRAWHGHKNEAKYVYVTKGSAIVAIVKIDNFKNPSKNQKIHRFILSDKNPQILFIPPGFANGFRSIEEDTRIIFFSTSTMEETQSDDYRFPADYWGNKVWEVENR